MTKNHSAGFMELINNIKNNSKITEYTVSEVHEILKNNGSVKLIDVRETEEWDNGFIPGALHLSKGIIERDINKHILDQNTPLILYCAGGYRSVIAADNLQKMGYTNVSSMAGGIRDWVNNGYEIEED